MSDYSSRKILIGVVTGTLLSSAVASVFALDTHNLLDSQGNPVLTTRPDECVQTPKTPNLPAKPYRICGDIVDRDFDGIFDDEDVCPDNTREEIGRGVEQSGPRKGCPIDSDNDAVPDYRDNCPRDTPLEVSKGVDARGCPRDSDQDGVADYKDMCPGTPFGIEINVDGCAVVIKDETPSVLSGDVAFAFNKADLSEPGQQSLQELLDNTGGPDLVNHLDIVGYTDSTGPDEYNLNLSEKRAASVANYFIGQGVSYDKIDQKGLGEENPVVPNDTKEGRRANRRVEITVTRYNKVNR
ncbi:MAG TPA: flagellar motor protein MotB [Gammaproteobacteria bacterium]|nr:flagellar motor protein MotB [Gammaproteobacteria bacterium]